MSEEKKEYKIEGRPSTIFRVKDRKNPYVMIDRRPIDNPNLSFKAKGILTYLMSRPDGWEVNITDLINHGKEGAAAIRTGLRELRDAHHVQYLPARELGRITGWVIEVYEIPYDDPIPAMQCDDLTPENELIPPDDDFQQVENLQVENRGQVISNINSNKTDIYIAQLAKTKHEPRNQDPIIKALFDNGTFPNALTHDFLRTWREKHTDERILQAIQTAGRGKPQKYVDSILVGWEANGYPLTREERIAAAKGNSKSSNKTGMTDLAAGLLRFEQRHAAEQGAD